MRLAPEETQRLNGICPRCDKPLTVGVLHRVAALADRPAGYRPAGAPASTNLIRLPQVIGELMSVGPQSKKVAAEAGRLVAATPAASAAVPSAPSVSVKQHDREEKAR